MSSTYEIVRSKIRKARESLRRSSSASPIFKGGGSIEVAVDARNSLPGRSIEDHALNTLEETSQTMRGVSETLNTVYDCLIMLYPPRK